MGLHRSQQLPDEQRLLEYILDRYNTASRPVYDASKNVTISFGMTLIQIADMVGIKNGFYFNARQMKAPILQYT